MKFRSYFILVVLLLGTIISSSPTLINAHHEVSVENKVIHVKAVEGELKYNKTEFKLQKNTNYTIIFTNPDEFQGHNFRIDIDKDLDPEENNKDDPDDLVIGTPNNSGAAGKNDTWTGSWKTPNKDTEIQYYCGYRSHYLNGMNGTFIIGDGLTNTEETTSISLILGLSALFVLATALNKLKNYF